MKICNALSLVAACSGCGKELNDKAGYAALQGVEFADRESIATGTEIRRVGNGFVAMAIQGRGEALSGPVAGPHQSRRSWILLDEHAADEEVKQMPAFPAYDLRCSDVDGVQQRVPDVDAYVIRFLRAICDR